MADRAQRVRGAAEEATGKAKSKTGRVTRNRSQQVSGAAKAAKGKAKRVVGTTRSRAKKATR
jgi:uncharacterized protein YjbJ (UPF0337 family)